ncbi:precorrin-6A/cobalt-precorrin-6A reductase [Mucilaginibacter aquaedulcis]|uniref:precorrin-6A/cobalt-precorrin-6A reductase n=1 Tax=Mucilaginibacter aquaedulcis TaxID=1187081 RepID=UPI0025B3BF3A|nr:precorrin-6A/cobalt-precorrin-6A reductase [Mucilaginibacter aquaedulcis]MDN3548212.1 precorrin-6A/cobalt-precorrin-6A reductase [Mucilaginibacter aquaedulcis]
MILLLGGTTEAKQVANSLDEAGLNYIYSSRTQIPFEGKGQYRFGSLDKDGLNTFCVNHHISCIIDACHPFATELHATVASLSGQLPLIRFEREFSERVLDPLVKYVSDYTEALTLINENNYQSMLALTGVQSIPRLRSYWQSHNCWFRIINRNYSLDFAAHHQFPVENLIFGLPHNKEEEIQLFNKLKPEVILTKESGLNGKLDEKIQAAIACNIPIFIIKRPELSASFKVVNNLKELLNMIR